MSVQEQARRQAACATCGEVKGIIAFGLCSRCYHNRPERLAKTRAVTVKRRAMVRDFIRKAKDRPCADCKAIYPYYVMDFDHRGDKRFNIGTMVDMSLDLIRIRTHKHRDK